MKRYVVILTKVKTPVMKTEDNFVYSADVITPVETTIIGMYKDLDKALSKKLEIEKSYEDNFYWISTVTISEVEMD